MYVVYRLIEVEDKTGPGKETLSDDNFATVYGAY